MKKRKYGGKKITIAAGVMLLCAAALVMFAVRAKAAYDTWDSLQYLEMRKSVNNSEKQHSLKDVETYGGNYTNDTGDIYADTSHYFDDIRLDAASRLTYGRKIRVDAGQVFNIVAAKEDTADAGGESGDAGLSFYWSMCEYDENGNIVFDGGWRKCSDIWEVGITDNTGTNYGLSGYPYGIGKETRKNNY